MLSLNFHNVYQLIKSEMISDTSTPPRGGNESRVKRSAKAISPEDKANGKPERICSLCKQLLKADSARGKKCQICTEVAKNQELYYH